MAVGVGIEAGESESKMLLASSAQMMNAFLELLTAIEQRQSKYKDFDKNPDKGLRLILSHMNKGGDVSQSIISYKDSRVFEEALKALYVPFAKFDIKDGEEKKCLYLTRSGSIGRKLTLKDDREKVDEAFKRFCVGISKGISELTPEEFFRLSDQKEVKSTGPFSFIEKEELKKYLMGTGFCFINSESKADCFDLVYRKEASDKVQGAIKDVMYSFSGKYGKERYEALLEEKKRQDLFIKDAIPKSDETIYVVDAAAPNTFVSVSQNEFCTHTVQRALKTGRLRKREILVDAFGKRNENMDELFGVIKQLSRPVILTQSEYLLCKGIREDGRAVIPSMDEYKKNYDDLCEKLKDKPYYKFRDILEKRSQGVIHTYLDIEPYKLSSIQKDLDDLGIKDFYKISEDSIAFNDNESERIRPVIEKELFEGLSPLSLIEDELYYRGKGDIYIDSPNKEDYPQYIYDAKNPFVHIKINEKDIVRYEDGIEKKVLDKTRDGYEKELLSLYREMDDPVAIAKKEYEKRSSYIRKRTEGNIVSDAKTFLENLSKNERAELKEIKEPYKTADLKLSGRQKEALLRCEELTDKNYFVDRDITKNVMNRDIDKKLSVKKEKDINV